MAKAWMKERFPPPTRGWTHMGIEDQTAGRVSPAHAGMDLPLTHRPPYGDRFPRPRGDGPASLSSRFTLRRFPPPTRGWTFWT